MLSMLDVHSVAWDRALSSFSQDKSETTHSLDSRCQALMEDRTHPEDDDDADADLADAAYYTASPGARTFPLSGTRKITVDITLPHNRHTRCKTVDLRLPRVGHSRH